MKKREYSEEYKVEVVRNYLSSPHGIRVVSRSYNLPSKNYITRWMEELVKKGKITAQECTIKTKSFLNKEEKHPYQTHGITARERQLERENEKLRAEVEFLKKLKELERWDAEGD